MNDGYSTTPGTLVALMVGLVIMVGMMYVSLWDPVTEDDPQMRPEPVQTPIRLVIRYKHEIEEERIADESSETSTSAVGALTGLDLDSPAEGDDTAEAHTTRHEPIVPRQ